MMLGYKSNKNVVYSSKYHVVWCPKYRRKVLMGAIAKRLFELIHKAAMRYRAEIIALEITPDRVHLLVEVDPQLGIHRLVKYIKGVTSHDLRKEFPSLSSRLPSLWTHSYFVSTVGGAPLEVIKQYVENQKKV
jgi:putative transposase